MPQQMLSDKGLSIFAFAAYHQLTSGEGVAEVILRDGSGHSADPQGLREVQALGLMTVDRERGVLTDRGREFLDRLLQQIRGTARHAERSTGLA